MEIINFFKSKSFSYLLTTLISKASVFIIIPVSAIFLNTENFSDFGIIFPTITLMTIASSFGLGSFLLKKIPELGNNQIDKIFSHSISFWIIFNFCFFTTIALISFFFFRENFYVINLTTGCFIFNSILVLNTSKYQLFDSNFKFLIYSSAVKFLYAVEILIYLIIKDVDLLLILCSFFVTSFIIFLISLYDSLKNIKFVWINPLKSNYNIVKFCFPLFLNSLLAYLLFINSRVILDYYNFVTYSSIFSLCYSFSAMLTIVFATFISLYVPKIFTAESKVLEKINEINESLSYLILFGSLLILIIFKFYTDFVLETDDYKNTSFYTAIFLSSQFIYIYYITKVDFLILKNKTRELLYINLIMALASVSLNFLCLYLFGPSGVFFSIILLQFLLAFLVSKRVKISNNYKTMFFTFMFMVFILSVSIIDSYFVYSSALILVTFLLYFKRQIIIQTLFFLNEKNSIH